MSVLCLSCPHCRALFQCDDSCAGQVTSCQACGGRIQVPAGPQTMAQWYYARAGQPVGPLTFEQLQELAAAGSVRPSDLVWSPTMTAWGAASTVPRLCPAPAVVVPPPIPKPPPPPQPQADYELAQSTPRPAAREIVPNLSLDGADPAEGFDYEESRKRGVAGAEPIRVEPEFHLDLGAPLPEPLPAVSGPVLEEPPIPLVEKEPELEWAPLADEPELSPPAALDEDVPIFLETTPAVAPTGAAGSEDAEPPGSYRVQDEEPVPVTDLSALRVGLPPENALPIAIPVEGPPARKRSREETAKAEKEAREVRLRHQFLTEVRAWRKVRFGLSLIYIALMTYAIMMALLFMVLMLAGYMAESRTGPGLSSLSMAHEGEVAALVGVFAVLLLLMDGAVNVTALIGYAFCLAVPRRVGAQGLAIASLVLAAVTFLNYGVAQCLPFFEYASMAAGFARWVVFLFFLRLLGQAMDTSWQTREVDSLLLMFVATGALWMISTITISWLKYRLSSATGEMDAAGGFTFICANIVLGVPMLYLFATTTRRFLYIVRDSAVMIDRRLYTGLETNSER